MPSSPRSRRLLGLGVRAAQAILLPLGLPPRPYTIAKTSLDVPSSCGAVERSNELGELLFGDPAEFADLEAAQLAGPKQVIDLVAADVQHLRYLLDGVCLQ